MIEYVFYDKEGRMKSAMSIIGQDIMSKRLLLIYCIDGIREAFDRIESEVDFRTLSEKFNDIVRKITDSCLLEKRIDITMQNIEYLMRKQFIDVNFGEEVLNEIKIVKSKISYILKEIKTLFWESEKNYINENFVVEGFLKKSKEKYMQLIGMYEFFLYKEKSVIEKIIDIWNAELTDCNSYVGGAYKLLVYATGLEAERVVNSVLHNNAIIYTSYITDKHTKVYQNREYGLIFEPNKENLLLMSIEDNQTADFELSVHDCDFSMDKDYFFRDNGIVGVQHIAHDTGRTYIPEQLLGDTYNEIVLVNNRYTMPKAVFVFNNATDFGKKESRKLAEKLNLKLIVLKK